MPNILTLNLSSSLGISKALLDLVCVVDVGVLSENKIGTSVTFNYLIFNLAPIIIYLKCEYFTLLAILLSMPL